MLSFPSCSLYPQARSQSLAAQTFDRRLKGTQQPCRNKREVKGALGVAQVRSHLPLSHKVVDAGLRQKPLLATFLEQEVCTVTAVREKDAEGTGHLARMVRGGSGRSLSSILPLSG